MSATEYAGFISDDDADRWLALMGELDQAQPWTDAYPEEESARAYAARMYAYNPGQLRAPKGVNIGGRWIKNLLSGSPAEDEDGSYLGRSRLRHGRPPRPAVPKPTSTNRYGAITSIPKASATNPPIEVGSDAELAVRLLGEGKAVNFTQTKGVSVLLDKISAIVADAKAKGADAPIYDLCGVTLANTSLFCVKNKGIPRLQMPQLKGKPKAGSPADARTRDSRGEVDLLPDFVEHLKTKGATIRGDSTQASHLLATQNQLEGSKVAGIAKFLEGGGTIEGPGLLVTEDNYIIDGHHRWAAVVGVNAADGNLENDPPMDLIRVGNMDILDVLREAFDYGVAQGIGPAGIGEKPSPEPDSGHSRLIAGPAVAIDEWGQGDDKLNLRDPLPGAGPRIPMRERLGTYAATFMGPERVTAKDKVIAALGAAWDRDSYQRLQAGEMIARPVRPQLGPSGRGTSPPRLHDVQKAQQTRAPKPGELGFREASENPDVWEPLGGFVYARRGSERPPSHVFRAVSEEEWTNIQRDGFIRSDGRMNLAADEGTVASLGDPSFYLPGALASDKPGTYRGRILRIGYRDEDGWTLDRDEYVKTTKSIPIDRIDMVSPSLSRERGKGADLGDWNVEQGPVRDEPQYRTAASITREAAQRAKARGSLVRGNKLLPKEFRGDRKRGLRNIIDALEPKASGTIGVSPARTSRNSLAGVDRYFESPRFRSFENTIDEVAADEGIRIERERAAGFWKGDMEAAAAVQYVDASPSAVDRFAGEIGRRYNQDEVAVFRSVGGGDGARYTIPVRDRAAAIAAIEALGIEGATIRGNSIVILDSDGSLAGKVADLGVLLRAPVEHEPGEVRFLKHGKDYEEDDRYPAASSRGRREGRQAHREASPQGYGGDHRASREVGSLRY